MEDKGIWIYDIETLVNCFTYTALNRDTREYVAFTVWEDINELYELVVHLSQCKGQIGFNNNNFDYPVIHYIIKERVKLLNLPAKKVVALIYKKAQDTIEREFSEIKEEDVIIPQLDLFRIHHFDNKSKMTSLKKIEMALRFENVQDMPYKHTEKITTKEQVKEILDYNKNDVAATDVFYTKTIPKIELRRGLLQKYGLNCLNFSDSKIGEQLMLKLYCHFTEQEESAVKKMRTYRNSFKFAECIPEYVKFSTPEFNELLTYLRGIEVTTLKESFKYSFTYNNFTFDLGTGGIHGNYKAGVYISDDKKVLVDADVGSLYPSLAIANHLYPAHLGEQFFSIYADNIVKPRLEAKKNGDKVMADGYKLSANSVYGKSNSEYSFLYDPLYTLKTTLAGQLSLCMLSEMLMTGVPNLQMIQINTDGLTVIIPVEHKRLYWNICQEWEKQTNLGLEYVAYDKIIIRDVSSYIAVTQAGKTKYKGAFKPTEEVLKDEEYHKAFNQNAVTLAIADYFLKGIPVEESIQNNVDIFDFCKTFNASHGWSCETVEGDEIIPQQKNNRYFISTAGKTFRKTKDDKIIEIEAGGKLVTIFNKSYKLPISEYNLDYQYYIDECYKIIHKVDGTDERLEQERKDAREKLKLEKEELTFKTYCLNKAPTNRQREMYKKDWLIEKYGLPKSREEIKAESL